VGDPDQIRPIPDEKGAGTPALDIAHAFSEHVIFLNENMRQMQEARAIHDVVVAVRDKNPRAIHWQPMDAPRASAVLIRHPAAADADMRSAMFSLFERLRRDIKGDEHAWQIVTFFNGTKPETQGMGVSQICELVEEYLEIKGHFKKDLRTGKMRRRERITGRLTMYVGFKFMITDKCVPHTSLRSKGKKIRDKTGNMVAAPEFTETKNGQIEVVKSMKQIKGTANVFVHSFSNPSFSAQDAGNVLAD
jgi:hypothetical protein